MQCHTFTLPMRISSTAGGTLHAEHSGAHYRRFNHCSKHFVRLFSLYLFNCFANLSGRAVVNVL